jgi:peptide/nickel transport system permease protein
LGWSKTANKPVLAAITQKFPATIEMVMVSIPLTILGGIFLGVKSAEHRNKPFDHTTRVLASMGYSLPAFWLGILLLAIFYAGLRWFPPERLGAYAMLTVTSQGWIRYTGIYTIDGLLNGQLWITLDALRHLVLPTIVLTITNIAIIVATTRSNMLRIIKKRYIYVTAGKELTQDEANSKHMRISVLFPASTLFGLFFGTLLTSIIVTEVVFNIDGLGRWVALSAISLDIPSVLGSTLLVGFFFVIVGLILDLLYAFLDPRII